MWQAADSNAKQNNEEVTKATYRLLDELIPAQIEDLITTCSKDADRYKDMVRLSFLFANSNLTLSLEAFKQ